MSEYIYLFFCIRDLSSFGEYIFLILSHLFFSSAGIQFFSPRSASSRIYLATVQLGPVEPGSGAGGGLEVAGGVRELRV